MNNLSALLVTLLSLTVAYGQEHGILLLSDYDDPTISVADVSVYFGSELLGTTDHTGSFHFPRNIRGTIRLEHADYNPGELRVRSKKGGVYDELLTMRQELYDSLKEAAAPLLYQQCPESANTEDYFVNPESPEMQRSFDNYIAATMRYPNRAKDNRAEGNVNIRIFLAADGKVQCAAILQGAGFELDKEALRLVYLVPLWKPAKKNGIPVASIQDVTVRFRLNDRK